MRKALLITTMLLSVNAFGQKPITIRSSKIGKYNNLELSRNVIGIDTFFRLSYQDNDYSYIVSIESQRFTKGQLKELADAIRSLDSVEIGKGNFSLIKLTNGASVSKAHMKGVGAYYRFSNADSKSATFKISSGRGLEDDIHRELNLSN